MTARRDFLEMNASDMELRDRAEFEAHAEIAQECRTSIMQKCCDLKQAWRDCSEAVCRRSRRCSDGRLICLKNRYRRSPPKKMSTAERALFTYQLRQKLDCALAESEARGEKNDLPDRIAQRAEQKFALLRAARGRRD